jgi:sterol desaturase/sphingolipid hydroxylase (fatty acid hydroxylase superfamily)
VFLGILLADLALYWIHRLMHTDELWRTHKWHHSIEHLYWFSGFRASFSQLAMTTVPNYLVPVLIIGASPQETTVGFSISIFFMLFIHSNLPIDLGPLRYVFVTPRMHRLHHSCEPEHRDKNFAGLFAFWDLLFGTFLDPRSAVLDFPLGLDRAEPRTRMIVGV